LDEEDYRPRNPFGDNPLYNPRDYINRYYLSYNPITTPMQNYSQQFNSSRTRPFQIETADGTYSDIETPIIVAASEQEAIDTYFQNIKYFRQAFLDREGYTMEYVQRGEVSARDLTQQKVFEVPVNIVTTIKGKILVEANNESEAMTKALDTKNTERVNTYITGRSGPTRVVQRDWGATAKEVKGKMATIK
jgi:hypothetical protein